MKEEFTRRADALPLAFIHFFPSPSCSRRRLISSNLDVVPPSAGGGGAEGADDFDSVLESFVAGARCGCWRADIGRPITGSER